jgi:hypothetical protein
MNQSNILTIPKLIIGDEDAFNKRSKVNALQVVFFFFLPIVIKH